MSEFEVLLVCEQPLPSSSRAGRPNYSLEVLSDLGCDVTVVCPRPRDSKDSDGIARFAYLPATFKQFSLSSRLQLVSLLRRRLKRLLHREQFDVVRTINIIPTYAALSTSPRPPVYAELTDFISDLYLQFDLPLKAVAVPLLRLLEWQIARRVDFASVETSVGRSYWKHIGLDAKKVVVIPNGVDTSHFRPNREARDLVRETIGLRDGESVLLYHGDIGKHDGLEQLLDATRIIVRRHPCRLMIVGDGPASYMKVLRKKAANGLETIVVFTGWIDYEKLPDYLAVADVCVVPLLPETRMSRANLHTRIREYLSMEKPFVVTKTPGLIESLGNLGYYVENPLDTWGLADVIYRALDLGITPNLRNRMRALATRLDWRNVVRHDKLVMEAIVNGTVSDMRHFDLQLAEEEDT